MIYLPVGPFAYSHRCLQQYPEHSISILWLVERKMIISLRSLDVPVMVTHVVSQIQIWVSKSSMPTYLGRERAWSDRVVHKRLNFGQDETRFPIRFAVIADLPFDRGGDQFLIASLPWWTKTSTSSNASTGRVSIDLFMVCRWLKELRVLIKLNKKGVKRWKTSPVHMHRMLYVCHCPSNQAIFGIDLMHLYEVPWFICHTR